MMGKSDWRGWTVRAVGLALVIFCSVFFSAQGIAKSKKQQAHKQAYATYQQKCLGCHVSVADPEKAGRTRDEWHLVVNVMHRYGMEMTAEEGEQIVDLLYSLRHGLEREPG